ncbi:MAG: hypothetical protein H7333_12230 [Bdellovibrionales bacterium]|nr:hypothetical protein [Oligoflexia bacterium]
MITLLTLFTFFIQFSGAQTSDAPMMQLHCSGGSGHDFTTLTIQTIEMNPRMVARLRQGDFDSGEIEVMPSDRILIPENRAYVDLQTMGQKFSLTFDFINPGMPAFFEYRDDTQEVPSLPQLFCTTE